MIFKKIQDRILNLLPKRHQIDKSILLEDCCSEISRLVASWIKESNRSARFYILKGDKVCKTKKSHDVLAVVIRDGEVYLIDPTVWQFFPHKESILVGKLDYLEESIKLSKEKYGGSWKVSEELKDSTLKEREEWLRIIKGNIKH